MGKLLGRIQLCYPLMLLLEFFALTITSAIKHDLIFLLDLMNLMQRIYKKPSELLLALKLSWWIIVISIVMRCVTLPRALRILTHTIPPKRNKIRKVVAFDSSILRAVHITDRLLALNHLCFTPTCWKRSIVTYRLLASAGMPAQIIFGVSGKSKEAVDGHAWVEVNRVPVFEAVTPEYVPTFLYPAFGGKPLAAFKDMRYTSETRTK